MSSSVSLTSNLSSAKPITITTGDSASIDAFSRLRVSSPETIFDSKQLYDSQPLFWDDAEVSGSGTGSVHSTAEARTRISVSNLTAGRRVRQTFQRFNYQPGKSMEMLSTFSNILSVSGIKKEVGFCGHNENNALLLRHQDGVASFVRRSGVTGAPVEEIVTQLNWNVDKMDGSGPSGITIDWSKTQIFFWDFEWLGVGRVRMGFVIDGIIRYCHYFNHANVLDVVYISDPNLPLSYTIENDGTGPADTFDHICSSVISEGGQQDKGITRSVDTPAATPVVAVTIGVTYAVVGIRLKSTHTNAISKVKEISMVTGTANDEFKWRLLLNPTVAGTFTYNSVTNSYVEAAIGVAANTVTGGTQLASGVASTSAPAAKVIESIRYIGVNIAQTVFDEMVLCVEILSSNQNIWGTLGWLDVS